MLHTVFKLLFPCFPQDVSEGIAKINDPHFLPFCRADCQKKADKWKETEQITQRKDRGAR